MCFPEIKNLPEIYFNQNLAISYFSSNRIISVQNFLSYRIFNILGILENLESTVILDLGCGNGIIENLTLFKKNFVIGLDVSYYMLNLFSKKTITLESILIDIQNTILPFRIKTIDFCTSISCIQWLKSISFFIFSNSKFHYEKYFNFKCISNFSVLQFFPMSKKNLYKILTIFTKIKRKNSVIIDKKIKKINKKYFIFYKT
jgi:SAM-dependent methyltransferase